MNKTLQYVLGGAASLLVLLFLIKEAQGNGDFKIFLEAANMIKGGKSPYQEWIFVSEGNYGQYFYSPLWAVLLIPFTYLPAFVPKFLWLGLNVFFLYRAFLLMQRMSGVEKGSKGLWIIYLLTFIAGVRFVLYNFNMIQMTIFILWSGLESLWLIKREQPLKGGFLLALAINIKILPIVLIPYLIYRSEYKATIYTFLFYIALLFLPFLFIGWEFNRELLSGWWSNIDPSRTDNLIETEIGQHSLTALIPALLTTVESTINLPRQILHLDASTAVQLTNIFRLGLVLLSIWFFRWPPFRKAESRSFEMRELAYLFLLIPLIFPHQQKYAFVLSIVAYFYLICYLYLNRTASKDKRYYWVFGLVILSFVLMTLSTDGVVGREFNKITQHYKLITWGALVLIPALYLAKGKAVSAEK